MFMDIYVALLLWDTGSYALRVCSMDISIKIHLVFHTIMLMPNNSINSAKFLPHRRHLPSDELVRSPIHVISA